MIRKFVLSSLAVLFVLGISSTVALADSISLTLANPTQSVSPTTGGTLSFTATIFAPVSNGDDIFLNLDATSVDAPVTLDDDGFYANFFPLTFSPNTSVTDVLFTLDIPSGTAIGDYTGSFDVYGGSDFNADDFLGTVNFEVDVANPVATPEPSSLMLLGTGMLGALGAFKRQRSKAV